MKIHIFKKPLIAALTIALLAVIAWSCEKDFDSDENTMKSFESAYAIMISYDSEVTSRIIDKNGPRPDELDLAFMTPLKEKQNIIMQIGHKGQVYMETTKMKPNNPIDIPSNGIHDPSEQIHKVIVANNIASFYTKNGKSLLQFPFELENQYELIEKIQASSKTMSPNEIANSVLTGSFYAENFEEFAKKKEAEGAVVLTIDGNLATVSYKEASKGLDIVTVIDKTNSKVLATRAYNEESEPIVTTIYAYDGPRDCPKTKLIGIMQNSMETLPSGRKVMKETTTVLENLKVKINI